MGRFMDCRLVFSKSRRFTAWFCCIALCFVLRPHLAQCTEDEPWVETVKTVQIKKNWKTAAIRIIARPKFLKENDGGLVVVAAANEANPTEVKIRDDKSIAVSGTANSLFDACFANTRSILVGPNFNTARYQIDLPCPKIVSVRRNYSETNVIVVEIGCDGLLPGYKVEAKVESANGEKATPPKINRTFLAVDGTPTIQFELPNSNSNMELVYYQLVIINGDGSRSQLIGFEQRGESLLNKIQEISRVRPLDVFKLADFVGSNQLKRRDFLDASKNASDNSRRYTISEKGREAGSSAQLKVLADWQEREFALRTVVSKANGGDEFQIAHQDGIPFSKMRHPRINFSNGRLTVEGNRSLLLHALVPNSRSFWLSNLSENAVAGNFIRLDLPSPKIKGANLVKGNKKVGPALELMVDGLMPGFKVFGTTIENDNAESAFVTQAFSEFKDIGRDRFPYIGQVVSESTHSELMIRFPSLQKVEGPSRHYFRLINFDGSQSQTLEIVQNGNSLARKVNFVDISRPLPVDTTSTVPSVELITVRKAIKKATEAGLKPVVYCMQSYVECLPAKLQNELVLEQGLAAGTAAKTGQVLLLGVNTNRVQSDLGEFRIREKSASIPNDAPLQFSYGSIFCSIIPERVVIDAGFLPPVEQEEQLAIDVSSIPLIEQDIEGYEVELDERPTPEKGETSVGRLKTGNDLVAIQVDSDPGVLLDPTASIREKGSAALSQVMINSTQQKLSRGEFVGVIGDIILRIVEKYEQSLLDSLINGQSVNQQSNDIFEEVADSLHVRLDQQIRENALADWERFSLRRNHPALLDINSNYIVGDDLVIWFVYWLMDNQLYYSTTHFRLVEDVTGRSLGVVSKQPIESNPNAESIDLILRELGDKASRNPSRTIRSFVGGKKKSLPKPARSKVAKGKAKISFSSGPDRIRIPINLAGNEARVAVGRLKQVGLATRKIGRLFESDKVVDSHPSQGTWVRPGTGVVLKNQKKSSKIGRHDVSGNNGNVESNRIEGETHR